jgi:transposase
MQFLIAGKATCKEKKKRPPQKGTHPGRGKLPAHLPRVEELNPVPAELRICPRCGSEMKTVGHSTCEYLDIEPAKLIVVVRMDERVACPHDDTIVSAPSPSQLIDRGKLGLTLVVECLADKVVEQMPIERLARKFKRMGVEISPQTIGRAVARAQHELSPLAKLIEDRVRGPGLLGTDATGLPVLDRDAPDGIRVGTIWCWTNGPWVAFDYVKTAGSIGPKVFLGEDFARKVQCDATFTLRFIERAGGWLPGCFAHARRRFVLAARSGDTLAKEVLDLIGEIFLVERESKKAGEDYAARLERRQRVSLVLFAKLRVWIDAHKGQIPPGTPLGKAIGYIDRQWRRLTLCLEDGELELTNNRRERELRALVLGRKNWLFVWGDEGGERLAQTLSIVATCLAHGINPRAYLHFVMRKIVLEEWPNERLAELMPDVITQLQPSLALPAPRRALAALAASGF